MLVVPEVEEDPVLLLGGEGDGDVGGRLHVERLELHVGGVVEEAEAGQILASLPAGNNHRKYFGRIEMDSDLYPGAHLQM